MSVLGVDVSSYQAWTASQWQIAKNSGCQFAFIKAAEAGVVDTRFTSHWQLSQSVGLGRGAYLYYHHITDPLAQARQLSQLTQGKNELPLVIDVEESGAFSQKDYGNRLHLCLQELQQVSGQRAMVYTSSSAWNRLVGVTDWAEDFMLWVAQYPFNHIPSGLEIETFKPLIPIGWAHWHYWQYAVGSINGIPGQVDLDYMPVNVTPTPAPTRRWSVWVSSAAIRSGPAYPNPALYYVKKGDIVVGSEIQGGWIHVAGGWINQVQVTEIV
jgi:GH25 family lysozyme M1 (1,4-beta-N-acetylmuramidase)